MAYLADSVQTGTTSVGWFSGLISRVPPHVYLNTRGNFGALPAVNRE